MSDVGVYGENDVFPKVAPYPQTRYGQFVAGF
jgi:hypothetical protein